ncbi:MAG: hypothetical protein HY814_06625 [Candidatus Riflebacteria bacterium]|nr:hypothetical protein [Candidatus Riflebacteria bacterium]
MKEPTASDQAAENADYDSPWKEALEHYFQPFLALFFPVAHDGIDWSRGHEFLDKELEKVVRDAELGRRLADKLVRVWRKDGEEEFVLVHVEGQGNRAGDFARRMYVYNYRLFDRYDRKVASLAVLTDDDPRWRPDRYEYELWGSRAGLSFPMVKLLDFAARRHDLEGSRNPFAMVTMAHLSALETAGDLQARCRSKSELVKALYEKGLGRGDILELFRFIDWMMALPKELDDRFWQELNRFEEEKKMPYITSVERLGIEKGIQQGIDQGLSQGQRRTLLRLLRRRFGDEFVSKGEGLLARLSEPEQFDQAQDWIMECATANELFERLEGLSLPRP